MHATREKHLKIMVRTPDEYNARVLRRCIRRWLRATVRLSISPRE